MSRMMPRNFLRIFEQSGVWQDKEGAELLVMRALDLVSSGAMSSAANRELLWFGRVPPIISL